MILTVRKFADPHPKAFLDGQFFAINSGSKRQFPDERWFIDRKAMETRDMVVFELASKFDLVGQKLPKRQMCRKHLPVDLSQQQSAATPAADYFDVNGNSVSTAWPRTVCGKRLESCKLRFGENGPLPFGSFPGAGLTR